MSEFRFYHPIEVRYGDLDPQGHVNNAKHLTYFEQARLTYWINMGIFTKDQSFMELGVILADVHITYLEPIHHGQNIKVGVRVAKLGNKSMTWEQNIVEADGGNAVIELFTNRLDPRVHPYFTNIAAQRVSAHFFIRRDGMVIQFVSCLQRAWHAGISCWQGRERCNDFSLGIELEGDDQTAFTPPQYQALSNLLAVLCRHFPVDSVAGHLDIAPGRKTDPGPYFDWSRVAPCMPR